MTSEANKLCRRQNLIAVTLFCISVSRYVTRVHVHEGARCAFMCTVVESLSGLVSSMGLLLTDKHAAIVAVTVGVLSDWITNTIVSPALKTVVCFVGAEAADSSVCGLRWDVQRRCQQCSLLTGLHSTCVNCSRSAVVGSRREGAYVR